jgi:hypothetical protein
MLPTYALSPGGLYLSDCRFKIQGQGWELKKCFREGRFDARACGFRCVGLAIEGLWFLCVGFKI